jgi:hypothetical protein
MDHDNTQQWTEWMAGALAAAIAEPETVDRIRNSLDHGDVQAFSEVVLENWKTFDITPPADKCDPYVTAYITIFKPPKFVERCVWIWPVAALDDALGTLDVGGTAGELKSSLVARRFLQCEWVLENQDEVIVVKKFVRGVCPPGTF